MGRRAWLLLVAMSLVLAGAAVALADPAQDFNSAVTAIKAGQLDTAIQDINRVIAVGASLEPRQLSNAYNFRGMCHEAAKQDQEALADYSKAIEIYPTSSEALGNRSLLYFKLGDREKSKIDAVAAKRIDRKVRVPKFEE